MLLELIGTWIYIIVVTYFIIRAIYQYLLVLSDRDKQSLKELVMKLEIKREGILLPLRLQAFERLILFLERIKPISLISRHLDPYNSMQQFQMNMLQNIRDEFEHNLSQQLFLPEQIWQTAKAAREEVLQTINLHAAGVGEDGTAADLAEKLIQSDIKLIDQAIKMIKEEMKVLS